MGTSSYTGVVHTKSDYAPDYDIAGSGMLNMRQSLSGKWQSLREREEALYQRLFRQANSLETFLVEVRQLFEKSPQDAQVFKFFEAGRIQGELATVIRRKETTEIRDLVITIDNQGKIPINFQRNMKQNHSIQVLVGEDGAGTLELGADVRQIKTAVNSLLKKNLNVDSNNLRALREILKDGSLLRKLKEELPEATFGFQGQDGQAIVTKSVQTPSPFSYTASDLKEAQALGFQSELYSEIIKARTEIKTILQTRSGLKSASIELQNAFERVWQANIEKNFEGLALFEKGGAYTALAGAFGEFQGALLFEYINQVGASNLAVPVISDTLKSGEQAKADITFLGKIGIQVKNYNPLSSRGILDTNIHPSKLAMYGNTHGKDFGEEDFMDFLANYFFNKSYREQNEGQMRILEEALGAFFGDIANLAMSDAVADTVSFYIIEGNYFVPGSYILQAIEENSKIQKKAIITGPSTPYGDEEYNFTEIRSKTRREALFSRWWVPGESSYVPTGENYVTYNSLLNSRISIRSGFNYQKLNLPRFSLY